MKKPREGFLAPLLRFLMVEGSQPRVSARQFVDFFFTSISARNRSGNPRQGCDSGVFSVVFMDIGLDRFLEETYTADQVS
jgi:hypothetical protein